MALSRGKKMLLLAAQQNANTEKLENKNTDLDDVCDKTKNFKDEDAASAGCSKWVTVPKSKTTSDIKVRLCRINKNQSRRTTSLSGDSSYEEDVDDSDRDPNFTYSSTDSSDVEKRSNKELDEEIDALELRNEEVEDENTIKKGKKKRAKPQLLQKNNKKLCRNTGKQYTSNSKNPQPIRERNLQQPCSNICKLKCYEKINHQSRETIFKNYWELGSLQLQREFTSKLITEVKPKYRYERIGSTRSFNHAFHFIVNGINVRVCKKFFKATLDINDRPIRTVLSKSNDGFIEADKRGKHGNHKVIDPTIKQGTHDFINSIPRIESHYLREQTRREYIENSTQKNESIDTEEEDIERTKQAKRVNENKKRMDNIKIGDIKILKVLKSEPRVLFVKTSYEQEEFMKIKVNDVKLKRGEKKKKPIEVEKIICPTAYRSKIPITERKKSDILDLIKGNYIPKFYGPFYDSILNP